jgi:hypothetical protein
MVLIVVLIAFVLIGLAIRSARKKASAEEDRQLTASADDQSNHDSTAWERTDTNHVLILEESTVRRTLAAKFLLDDLYVSSFDSSLIGFSFTRDMLVLGFPDHCVSLPFTSVVAVDVLRDGVTLTQVNRGSQLVGAAVGGVMFGGAGALAGALSGSTRSRERVSEIALKITVEDPVDPIHVVKILSSNHRRGLDLENEAVKSAVQRVEKLEAQLVIAMRSAAKWSSDRETTTPPGMDTKVHEWESRTEIHVVDWTSEPLIHLFSRKLVTREELFALAKARKRGPCTIKVATPADAQRFAAALTSLGIRVDSQDERQRCLGPGQRT